MISKREIFVLNETYKCLGNRSGIFRAWRDQIKRWESRWESRLGSTVTVLFSWSKKNHTIKTKKNNKLKKKAKSQKEKNRKKISQHKKRYSYYAIKRRRRRDEDDGSNETTAASSVVVYLLLFRCLDFWYLYNLLLVVLLYQNVHFLDDGDNTISTTN